jgi:hypothetical protein
LSAAGSTGTAGFVMTSNGASAPTWQALPASGITITDDTTTNATRYLAFTSATSGSITGQNVASTKLQFNPSTGTLSSTSFSSSAGSNFATSSGLVGIGTSSPDSSNKLQVAGDIGVSWAANEFIGMKFGSGSSYKMGLMLNDATRECKVWSQSVDSDDKITFYTGSTPTERMRIASTGSVSIGNTTDNGAGRNGFTGTTFAPNITLTDAATIAWDTSTGQVATFTFVSSNRTMGAPTNLVNGGFYALAVIQNAGSNTLTWNAVFKWPGGTAPTLSTGASAKDYFTFRSDGTNLYQQGSSLGVA